MGQCDECGKPACCFVRDTYLEIEYDGRVQHVPGALRRLCAEHERGPRDIDVRDNPTQYQHRILYPGMNFRPTAA